MWDHFGSLEYFITVNYIDPNLNVFPLVGKIVFKFVETFCCTCSILYILVPVLNGRSLIRGWHLFPFLTFTMILLGFNEPVSSVEECCKSTANFKTMQYPRQESGDDRDTDAGIPRKDEHAEGTKGCTRTKSRTGQ